MGSLFGLNDFGISLPQLLRLKDRAIEVRMGLRRMNHERLFPYAPEARRRKIEAWARRMYRTVRERWPSRVIHRIGPTRYPYGFTSRLAARELRRCLRIPEVDTIWLVRIQGIRKRRLLPEIGWYAVKVRSAVQVEGCRRGFQTYEESVYLVKARSDQRARRKIERKFAEQARYLNLRGEQVRWHLEKVLNVDNLIDRDISPEGTEVYWELKKRRMRREYEWHPLEKPKSSRT